MSLNRYMDYGNPMRRPGAAIRSQYALPPAFKVGELPTPKAPEYQRQRTSVGVQPKWNGEKPNFMSFPATAAAVSGVVGGIGKYRDTKEAEREKARKDSEREAEQTERESRRTTVPRKAGPNDEPVDSLNDPGAPSFPPSQNPSSQNPQVPGQVEMDFDGPGEAPFTQLSFNFNMPPRSSSTPFPAPITSTNQRKFTSTRGKEAPTMATPGMNPWQQKQERTGYEGPVVSEPNRGPAPTTNKGAPLLGPRNRRRR